MPGTPGDIWLTPELADYFNNASDAQLLRTQRELVRDVAAQMTRMNLEQRRVTNKLDRDLGDRLFFKRDGSDITRHSQRAVDRAVNKAAIEAQQQFERRADFAVLRATLSHTRALADALRDRGILVPQTAAERAARKIASSRTERFGKTRVQLADSAVSRHKSRINSLIQQQTGGPARNDATRSTTARDLIQTAGSVGLGGQRTPGGSSLKDMGRILASEAMDASYEASRELIRLSGLAFVYRRSVGGRANNGKGDICDELNANVFGGIEDLLLDAGIAPESVDLRGLYPVGDAPDYPHANCRCYLEPLIG